MHITENRYATVLVKDGAAHIKTDLEWDVLGFAVGENVDVEVPVLTGTAKPTTTQYQKLNSAIHTGGGVGMYHIPGSTPEAPTVEWALGGKKPKRETMIGDRELKKAYDTLNFHTTDAVDMVYLGCPHTECRRPDVLARKLEGKKCKNPALDHDGAVAVRCGQKTWDTLNLRGCRRATDVGHMPGRHGGRAGGR
jgi:predicted aconitase